MADESTMARADSECERSGMESFVSSSADLSGRIMCVEYTSVQGAGGGTHCQFGTSGKSSS